VPGRHILVVDDNADARETLAVALQLEGFPVRTAENGREALDMAAAVRPRLILLDLMMPVMDGWQVVGAMRADASLATVPIVIVSAATSAPPAGIPFLRKPAAIEELLDIVRRGLTPVGGG
jgi:CheY-like chemotaxis protein